MGAAIAASAAMGAAGGAAGAAGGAAGGAGGGAGGGGGGGGGGALQLVFVVQGVAVTSKLPGVSPQYKDLSGSFAWANLQFDLPMSDAWCSLTAKGCPKGWKNATTANSTNTSDSTTRRLQDITDSQDVAGAPNEEDEAEPEKDPDQVFLDNAFLVVFGLLVITLLHTVIESGLRAIERGVPPIMEKNPQIEVLFVQGAQMGLMQSSLAAFAYDKAGWPVYLMAGAVLVFLIVMNLLIMVWVKQINHIHGHMHALALMYARTHDTRVHSSGSSFI